MNRGRGKDQQESSEEESSENEQESSEDEQEEKQEEKQEYTWKGETYVRCPRPRGLHRIPRILTPLKLQQIEKDFPWLLITPMPKGLNRSQRAKWTRFRKKITGNPNYLKPPATTSVAQRIRKGEKAAPCPSESMGYWRRRAEDAENKIEELQETVKKLQETAEKLQTEAQPTRQFPRVNAQFQLRPGAANLVVLNPEHLETISGKLTDEEIDRIERYAINPCRVSLLFQHMELLTEKDARMKGPRRAEIKTTVEEGHLTGHITKEGETLARLLVKAQRRKQGTGIDASASTRRVLRERG
jgi:hypothetical protein